MEIFDSIVAFFTEFYAGIKAFFIEFYNGIKDFFTNIFKSVYDYIGDLPVLLLDKFLSFIVWVLDQLSELCTTCSGSSGLAAKLQAAFDGLSPTVLYCLSHSGLMTCFGILALGYSIWLGRKVLHIVTLGYV